MPYMRDVGDLEKIVTTIFVLASQTLTFSLRNALIG